VKISRHTPLDQVAEMLGTLANDEDAQSMLDVLLEAGVKDTDELSDKQWLEFVGRSRLRTLNKLAPNVVATMRRIANQAG
jgi:hypothetical protein